MGGKSIGQINGGAERDRTADPLLAKQVLSQLSYSPFLELTPGNRGPWLANTPASSSPSLQPFKIMVGPGRLELPTPRLSSVCSNQLSYGPISVKPNEAVLVFLKKEKRGRRGSPYRRALARGVFLSIGA